MPPCLSMGLKAVEPASQGLRPLMNQNKPAIGKFISQAPCHRRGGVSDWHPSSLTGPPALSHREWPSLPKEPPPGLGAVCLLPFLLSFLMTRVTPVMKSPFRVPSALTLAFPLCSSESDSSQRHTRETLEAGVSSRWLGLPRGFPQGCSQY